MNGAPTTAAEAVAADVTRLTRAQPEWSVCHNGDWVGIQTSRAAVRLTVVAGFLEYWHEDMGLVPNEGGTGVPCAAWAADIAFPVDEKGAGRVAALMLAGAHAKATTRTRQRVH